MIIIAGSSHPRLADTIASALKVPCIHAITQRFEDQELRIQVPGNLQGKEVVIIQSTCKPANDHLMELLLLVDTVRRAGARRITAVVPYFGYSRQDRPSHEHSPISASLVATMLDAAGVSRLITLDLHSKQSEGFFNISVPNLDATRMFTPLFTNTNNCIVVSPDSGGLYRAQKFSQQLGTELAVINKQRQADNRCIMTQMLGDVRGKHCIIIDDIIDTAGTLCGAAELLVSSGAKSIVACVTHAVLSGQAMELVEQSPIEALYVTDSIPHLALPGKVKVLPIAVLLADALALAK